jgi:hypothetical protein
MKGYRVIPFKKLSLGLIQLSLLASTITVGVNSTAFGKTLSSQMSKTCSNSCTPRNLDSPGLTGTAISSLSLKKQYKELESIVLCGFCSVSFKGHLSLYSGVSPPIV